MKLRTKHLYYRKVAYMMFGTLPMSSFDQNLPKVILCG